LRTNRVPWRRLFSEAALVIVSVYVAIVLEGMSGDRARKSDATDALAQLLEELREDRRDLTDVMAEQEEQSRRYADLRRWFAAPSMMPMDSVGETIDSVAYQNPTLFPRNSSWTTMVAGGKLSFLSDPTMVTRLADLYENANERIEVMGTRYDDSFLRLTEQSTWKLWDSERRRLLTDDQQTITIFRNELRSIASWNQYYREFLGEYGETVDALMDDVEEYLRARGLTSGNPDG